MDKKPSLWTLSFTGMCLSCFFQFMTHYALITALPIFVVDVLKEDNHAVGLAVTFFQIGAVACRPFAGKWIDELDKKFFLLISLALFLLTSVSYIGVQSILILLILRLFHGIGFGMGTTSTSTIAAIVAPESRKGEGIGYLAMFTSLAMVLGPFMSLTIVLHYSFTILYGVCGGMALLAFLFGMFTKVSGSKPETKEKLTKSTSWRDFIELKALPAAITGFLLALVYGGILAFVPTYAKNLGIIETASAFFALYAIAIVVPRPFIGRLFDQKGANYIIYPAMIIFTIGMVGLSQIQDSTGFLAAGLVIGLGFGALHPSFQAMAVNTCPNQRKGLATATYFLFFDIGIGVGAYVLGLVASYTNYSTMYLLSSAIMMVNLFVYYLLGRKKDNILIKVSKLKK
ncbi:MFS transporter [Propionispora vibrioides]|uniref:Predicted arabinose efflux permease, MFS family n=1 Tax=Propionispora vibrioides TaxID=112903 RepID=A0A1H8Y2B7_9FIRM|nr:MFS transporter [Propionispora vibrioides]SEP46202.1 Predicted arabinose efflux permease, MFS family [Propionispora vibrioides]